MKAPSLVKAHILDGPRLLLETSSAERAAWMSAFIRRVERTVDSTQELRKADSS